MPRVAVATARYGDPWDELSVLAARVAGALAYTAEVDVLVPSSGASTPEVRWDGACRLILFPATAPDLRHRTAWRLVTLGVGDHVGPGACTCPSHDTRRPFPPLVETQLVLAEGGDSPALYEHLRTNSYDTVVLVGLHSPVACFGVRALPEDQLLFLIPGERDVGTALRVHDLCLERSERILVCTEAERRWMVDRVGQDRPERVENLGFLVGVNTVVRPESPGNEEGGFVVVAGDWLAPSSLRWYRPWATALASKLPAGIELRLVGPGASGLAGGIAQTDARIDSWWWMSRARAVIDPVPHRIIGQEVLEALLLGVPVVVAADGDATREHAETGNCGLWYLADDELVASVECLLDENVARVLTEQGQLYAAGRFGDTESYVKRVTGAILGPSDMTEQPAQ